MVLKLELGSRLNWKIKSFQGSYKLKWSTARYITHSQWKTRQNFYKKLEHLIWKYKNKLALLLVLKIKIAGNTNASAASQNTRRKLYNEVLERVKESKLGTCSKSMWIKQTWSTSHIPLYSCKWISKSFISGWKHK